MDVMLTDQANPIIRSNAHRAYLVVRDRIVRCEIQPGQRIKIAELAVELGVSPGAMREALSRLTADHLVVAKDQFGFRATLITPEELDDLTEVRVDIETKALERSILNGDKAWASDLAEAFKNLKYAAEPIAGSALAHARFHDVLVSECGSPTLLRIRSSLYQSSERYRYFATQRPKSPRNVDDEHRQICEAALDRDVEAAKARLGAHIRTTAVFVKAALAGGLTS
jgi:DNA-binding GntR family transcriptional regulator